MRNFLISLAVVLAFMTGALLAKQPTVKYCNDVRSTTTWNI